MINNKSLISYIAVCSLLWLFIIPITEIIINKGSDSQNLSILSESIVDEKKYDGLRHNDKKNLVHQMLMVEYLNNRDLSDLNINTLQTLNIEENITALALFFVPNYEIDILKRNSGLAINRTGFLGERMRLPETFGNINKERTELSNSISNLLKEDLYFNEENTIQEESSFSGKTTILFDFEKFKIELRNKELLELISVLEYNNVKEELKYKYASYLLIIFVLFTMVMLVLFEAIYNDVVDFMDYKKELKSYNMADTSGFSFACLSLICIISIIVLSGLFNVAREVYFLDVDRIRDIGFIASFIFPTKYLIGVLGELYINHVPLSRLVLLLFTPLFWVIYIYLISSTVKLSKKKN